MTDVATNTGLAVPTVDARRRLAIVLSLILTLAAAGAALFLVRGVDNQLTDVGQTYEIRKNALELALAITDIETSQRGYLLTLDKSYLKPYRAADALIDQSYDRLLTLLDGQPDRRNQIMALRSAIDEKRAEVSSTIDLAENGSLNQALEVVRSDAGRALMEKIIGGIRAFIAEEDARLDQRNLDVQNYRQWLVAAILASLAASATLAYALFNRTQKQVSDLDRTRQALQVHNDELALDLRRRTEEAEQSRAHAERERERVETLLQDTNHRIGNSLATVSSLLALQQARSKSDEVRAALEAAQARVQAIASAHRRLRLGADLETAQASEFLTAVIEDLHSTQPADLKVEFVSSFDPIVIKARDATTLGIVLGELVTNAIKHAFDATKAGHIWTQLSRNADGVAVLSVADDGKGLPPERANDGGLGSMIIKQLAHQFGGVPSYAPRPGGGTIVSVTLPGLDSSS